MQLKCKPDSRGNPVVPGMRISLMPHQVHGVKWMVDCENDPKLGNLENTDIEEEQSNYNEVKSVRSVGGGILADDMGLGKTIQSIAMMVHNRPQRTDPVKVMYLSFLLTQTTLIVAPVSLIRQWARELERRTKKRIFKVHIHHGKTALKTEKEFLSYDVIITTYGTLMQGF